MTALGKRFVLPINPYVNPLEDSTQLDTIYFTDADKVRFQNGKLRKILGWTRVFSQNDQRIIGAARNIFSYRDASNEPITIIGTHRSLYAVIQGSLFYNITPLLLATTTIADTFSTEYNAGVNVNVTTTVGSNVVTLDIMQYLNNNELIEISGVVGPVNGIPGASFNAIFPAAVISNDEIQIALNTSATSSGTVSVNMTWATSYLYVNDEDFGYMKGDRIKILAATDVDGILAASINGETIISNVVNADTFIIQTDTIATSSVIAGGGSATTIQYQIPAGLQYQSNGQGYGGGEYGAGLYGDSKTFTNQSANTPPRIWSMDTITNITYSGSPPTISAIDKYLILTPGDSIGSATGDGQNVYYWNGDVTVAPILVPGAPYFVKWLYVSNDAVCTLGGNFASPAPSVGIANLFISSDQNNILGTGAWGPIGPSTFYTFATLDQAGSLISQASTRDIDLIFTEDEVYRVEFVGKPDIWIFSRLFTSDGIQAPKARTEIEDAVIWMGKSDFFVFDRSSVDILPNNTLKRFVFDNLNQAQNLQCFVHSNIAYNEVWFFWVSGADNNPNNYAMYNYKEKTWITGTMPRSASEEPLNINTTPYMMQSQLSTNFYPVSISSYFYNLGPNPLNTIDTSQNITFELTTPLFLMVGDYIQISGATNTNGIPSTEINGNKEITAINVVSPGVYNVQITSISTPATSTGTGGGISIGVGTSIIGLDLGTLTGRVNANEEISFTYNGTASVGGISPTYLNFLPPNVIPVRAISGTIVQINTNMPMAIFSTSTQTIMNPIGAPDSFYITYSPSDRLFQQEVGHDDYNSSYVYGQPGIQQLAPMLAYATTNMAQVGNPDGDDLMAIYTLFPDTVQTGNPDISPNLTLTVTGRLYAQSPIITPSLGGTNGVYTITPTTQKIDLMFMARQRQYSISSFVLGADFLIGKWIEELRPSSTR